MAARNCFAIVPVALLSCAAAALPPAPDHVVIVVEENHGYAQVIGNGAAPYMNELATQGASFTRCYAITHPSQPNYLHLYSGSNQGVLDSNVPTGQPFTTPNLGAALLARGVSFLAYSQGLPSIGSNVASSGNYVRRHSPWANWQAVPQGLNQTPPTIHLPFTMFPADYSQLPRVCFVVPDLQNDMHDGTIAQADNWLRTNIKPYADWAMSNNSLLIVVWDEDDSTSDNQIAMMFYGPMVVTGQVDSTWTLHSLLRTIEDMHGTTHSGVAAKATPIAGPFTTDPNLRIARFGAGDSARPTRDTYLESASPSTVRGSAALVVADGSPATQSLVRFDEVFGSDPDQVPVGATIVSAKLILTTGQTGGDTTANIMSVHRMIADWDDSATWNSMVAGVSANGVEAATDSDYYAVPNILNAPAIFDVTASAQLWSADPASNRGWVIMPAGTDGWRANSSEATGVASRPRFEVVFVAPPCSADFNADGFLDFTDFDAFVSAFELGSAVADFNADGFLDFTDFDAFVTAFEAGC